MVILAAVLAVSAPVSWWAAWRSKVRLMAAMKPLPMLALAGIALILPWQGALSVAVLAALVLGVVGDVALLDPPSGRPPRTYGLPVGLGSFLLGHLAYLVAVWLAPQTGPPFPWPAVPAAVGALVLLATLGRSVVGAAAALKVPVVVYQVVLLTLATAAAARGPWLLLVGAILFVASDLLLGWSMFRRKRSWMPPEVMVTYHVAQVLLVLGLLGAGG